MCNLRSFEIQEIGPRSITLAGGPVTEADRAAGGRLPVRLPAETRKNGLGWPARIRQQRMPPPAVRKS